MSKPTTIDAYVDMLNEEGKVYFTQLKHLILKAYPYICEMLFVSNPYFYLSKHEHIKYHYRPSIMLVFYKDHVNLFSTANQKYADKLSGYKMTDKYTLQIYFNQSLDEELLISLFKDSLVLSE